MVAGRKWCRELQEDFQHRCCTLQAYPEYKLSPWALNQGQECNVYYPDQEEYILAFSQQLLAEATS